MQSVHLIYNLLSCRKWVCKASLAMWVWLGLVWFGDLVQRDFVLWRKVHCEVSLAIWVWLGFSAGTSWQLGMRQLLLLLLALQLLTLQLPALQLLILHTSYYWCQPSVQVASRYLELHTYEQFPLLSDRPCKVKVISPKNESFVWLDEPSAHLQLLHPQTCLPFWSTFFTPLLLLVISFSSFLPPPFIRADLDAPLSQLDLRPHDLWSGTLIICSHPTRKWAPCSL